MLDWHQLAFSDLAQVQRFLRVNEFDPDSPKTWNGENVRAEAVEYLTRHFGYRIPKKLPKGPGA